MGPLDKGIKPLASQMKGLKYGDLVPKSYDFISFRFLLIFPFLARSRRFWMTS